MNHRAIIGAAIIAVIAGLGAWQTSGSVVTGIIAALVPLAALFPTSYRPGATALSLGLIAALTLSAGCDPMWRATRMVRDAGTMINDSLAAVHKTKRLKCKATHGAKTKPFAKCLNESRERIAFLQWRKFGLPGLDTGLISVVTTLTLYDKASGKKLSWDLFVKMIKPLACGVSRAALAWKDLLGAKAAAVIAITNAIKGVTCVR